MGSAQSTPDVSTPVMDGKTPLTADGSPAVDGKTPSTATELPAETGNSAQKDTKKTEKKLLITYPSFSSNQESEVPYKQFNHIKKFFIKQNDSEKTLESLNLTEFQPNGSRYNDNSISLTGGINITDLTPQRNIEKKRYTKYDLFQVLRDIDSDFQKGGGEGDGGVSEDNVSSLNDEKSLQHLKNIILNELENLKKSKLSQSGGSGCGCENPKKQFSMKHVNIIPNSVQEGGGDDSSSDELDSSSGLESDSSELGKKKKVNKKKVNQKKVNQKFTLNDDISNSDSDYSSRFIVETSESSIKKSTSNGDDSSFKKSKVSKKKKY